MTIQHVFGIYRVSYHYAEWLRCYCVYNIIDHWFSRLHVEPVSATHTTANISSYRTPPHAGKPVFYDKTS